MYKQKWGLARSLWAGQRPHSHPHPGAGPAAVVPSRGSAEPLALGSHPCLLYLPVSNGGRAWGHSGFSREALDGWAHLMEGDDSCQKNLQWYAQGCARRMRQCRGGSPGHRGPSLAQDDFPAGRMSCPLLLTPGLHVLRPAGCRDWNFLTPESSAVLPQHPLESPLLPPGSVCLWFCTGEKNRSKRRFPGALAPRRLSGSRQQHRAALSSSLLQHMRTASCGFQQQLRAMRRSPKSRQGLPARVGLSAA